jgi:hypothetical protein
MPIMPEPLVERHVPSDHPPAGFHSMVGGVVATDKRIWWSAMMIGGDETAAWDLLRYSAGAIRCWSTFSAAIKCSLALMTRSGIGVACTFKK